MTLSAASLEKLPCHVDFPHIFSIALFFFISIFRLKEAAWPSGLRRYCFELQASVRSCRLEVEFGPGLGQADLSIWLGQCPDDLLTSYATLLALWVGDGNKCNTGSSVQSIWRSFRILCCLVIGDSSGNRGCGYHWRRQLHLGCRCLHHSPAGILLHGGPSIQSL